MTFSAISRWLLLLSLLAGTSLQAHAGDELENWRVAVAQTRGLAENDIPQAYAKVQRLQTDMPQDATSADKVHLLNLLARIELYRADSSQTEHYAKQAIQLAETNNDRTGQAEAYLILSLNSVNQSDFDQLKSSIQRSMELLRGEDRPDLLVEAMLRTSMMYLRFGLLDESTKMAMQTLEVAKQTNNPLAMTYAHQGVAIVYEQSHNYSEARDHYSKMLGYAQEAHSRLLEAGAMLSLGSVLSDLGNVASGERLVRDGVAIYRKAGGPFYTAHALNMLANMQRKQNHLAEALATLNEALEIYEQRRNKVGLWWTLRNRSEVLETSHKLALSQADAEYGYKLAREMGVAIYLGESARRLAQLAAIKGDYQKAYIMFAEADEMAKKNTFEKSRKRITDLAQQFEEESKKRKIEELILSNEAQAERQRWLWTILISSFGFLGVTVFFLMRLRSTNRKLQTANDQLDQTGNTLKATLDAVPDLLFELGLDGTYYDFHSPQSELLVKPAEQLLGRKISDVLPADVADICLAGLQEANERGLSLGKQYSLTLPQGRCWFEMSVARKPVAVGELSRFIMLVRDITERKQIEEELRSHRERLEEMVTERATALRASEARLRALIDNLPFEFWGMDSELRYTMQNAVSLKNYGSVVGKNIEALGLPPDIAAQWIAQDRKVLGGELLHEQYEKDVAGEHRTFESLAAPVFVDGRVVGIVGVGIDITERKQMENALRESQQVLNEAQRIAQVGSWEMDLQNNVLTWSDEVYRIFEINPQQFGASYEAFMNTVHPDDRESLDRIYKTSLENRERFEFEHRLLMPDGRIKYVFERCENYYDDDGRVLRSIGTVQDITERKRLEAELMASRNFLDSVIDAVPDPIFVKDRQHRWILLNDANCRFTGLSREALLGKSDYDIFPESEADVFWAKDELVFESGEVNLNEEKFTSVDGVTHHIQTKKTPFVSADGQQMLVGVIRDITERMNYEAAREAALAEAQRLASLRSEFIAHMSHELRTPLNGILGYAQMLGRDEKLDEKQLASVEVIRQSGEHLLALIEDILDLARIESGRMQFELTDIPLRKFLNSVVGMVSVRARAKHIDLVTEFASDLPQGIRCDEKRLRQVLLNLLSNAVKFTDQGSVTLTVKREIPSHLSFMIADTGIGIAQEDREKIFKAFEQVGDRRYRVGGTGLGLAISHQLIGLMGGDITFDSVPGKGSSFHFELDLPEVSLEAGTLLMPEAEEIREESEQTGEAGGTMIAPPQAMMQELHRLALLGNMRDIALYTDRIAQEDARCQPFAARVKRLTEQFRSKAILALVEEYLS